MAVAMFCFVLGDVGSSLSQAFLPAYAISASATSKATFDLNAARPAISSILRVCWAISSVCVVVSSVIITRGASAFTSDLGVAKAINRALPFTALTLATHASAVTLEGLLLVQRDLGFLCKTYASIGIAAVAAHQFIVRSKCLGLGAVWGVYVAFQVSRIAVFSWRSGLFSRGTQELPGANDLFTTA